MADGLAGGVLRWFGAMYFLRVALPVGSSGLNVWNWGILRNDPRSFCPYGAGDSGWCAVPGLPLRSIRGYFHFLPPGGKSGELRIIVSHISESRFGPPGVVGLQPLPKTRSSLSSRDERGTASQGSWWFFGVDVRATCPALELLF